MLPGIYLLITDTRESVSVRVTTYHAVTHSVHSYVPINNPLCVLFYVSHQYREIVIGRDKGALHVVCLYGDVKKNKLFNMTTCYYYVSKSLHL